MAQKARKIEVEFRATPGGSSPSPSAGPFNTIAELERSMRQVAKKVKGKSKARARR